MTYFVSREINKLESIILIVSRLAVHEGMAGRRQTRLRLRIYLGREIEGRRAQSERNGSLGVTCNITYFSDLIRFEPKHFDFTFCKLLSLFCACE